MIWWFEEHLSEYPMFTVCLIGFILGALAATLAWRWIP